MSSATLETPSKAAAAKISTLDLSSPAKLKFEAEPTESEVPKKAAVDREELAKRFVGDLECEEKDEPILQET